jgi:selenocysteine lyase/cysteine desulfurase
MDVRACHIDFLSCGGPKWLMGPAGQGFIYVRNELLDELHSPFAGCISVAGWQDWRDYHLSFLPDARRFELGCGNTAGQVGLLAAVRLLLKIDVQAIQAWTLHLTDLLIQDLEHLHCDLISNSSPKRRSAIVSFVPVCGVDRAYEQLVAQDVVIAKREEVIRVSPHCYNTEEEIRQVGRVLNDTNA